MHMDGDSVAEEAQYNSLPLQAKTAGMRQVMPWCKISKTPVHDIIACKMWPHIKKHPVHLPMLGLDTMVPKMWCSLQ